MFRLVQTIFWLPTHLKTNQAHLEELAKACEAKLSDKKSESEEKSSTSENDEEVEPKKAK